MSDAIDFVLDEDDIPKLINAFIEANDFDTAEDADTLVDALHDFLQDVGVNTCLRMLFDEAMKKERLHAAEVGFEEGYEACASGAWEECISAWEDSKTRASFSKACCPSCGGRLTTWNFVKSNSGRVIGSREVCRDCQVVIVEEDE